MLDDDLDQDGFVLADDCDDENPDINPDGVELAENGIDEDCDGIDWIITSTEEESNVLFNIYPSPVREQLFVESEHAIESIEILSLDGKLVLKTDTPEESINVSAIQSGLYVCRVRLLSGKSGFKKLVIE